MSSPPASPFESIARMEREERERRARERAKKKAKKKAAKKKRVTKKKTSKKATKKRATKKKTSKKKAKKKTAKKKAVRKKAKKKRTTKKKVSKTRRKKTGSRAGSRFKMGLERKRIKVIDVGSGSLVNHEVEVITPDKLLGYMRKGRKTFLVHVPSGGAFASSASRARVERAAHRALQDPAVKSFLKRRSTKDAIRAAGLYGDPIPASVVRSGMSEFAQILQQEGLS